MPSGAREDSDFDLLSSPSSLSQSNVNFSSLIHNELVQFIDFILPFTQIPLDVVHEMIEHYHHEKRIQSLLHGDHLQVWEVPLHQISAYYPPQYEETLAPLTKQLAEKSPSDSNVKLIKLLDLLILLTILCRGKLRDKAQLLFSYYAVHEPEGMLEWEHSQFIQRVSSCLKKIGAIKGSEISVHDANYLAFLARVKEGGRGFHLSLTFNDFFHWIQNSSETSPAFVFIRLINHFLRICQTLDSRIDSLSSFIAEVTSDNFSTQTMQVPKLSSSYKFAPACPYLLFLTDKSVHFILQPPECSDVSSETYYVRIDTIHPFSQSSFVISNHERTPACCEKYYIKSAFQKLTPIVSYQSTIRLDIDRCLLPDTHYHFTFYTSSEIRYPVISAKTKPHQSALAPSDKVCVVTF